MNDKIKKKKDRSNKSGSKKEQVEKDKRKKRILWLILLLLCLLSGYVTYEFFIKPKTVPVSVTAGDFLPDGKDASKMTDKEVQQYAQKAVDSSMFNLKIVSTATVDSKTLASNLAIQNPPTNTYPVSVSITDDATNEELYTSGAIQPGEEIKSPKFSKTLDSGEHKATATFSVYNPTTKKEQGKVQSELTLTFK